MSLKFLLYIVVVCITCARSDELSDDEGSGSYEDEPIADDNQNLDQVVSFQSPNNELYFTQATVVEAKETSNNSVAEDAVEEPKKENPRRIKPTITNSSIATKEDEANNSTNTNEVILEERIAVPSPATTNPVDVMSNNTVGTTTSTSTVTTVPPQNILPNNPSNSSEEAENKESTTNIFKAFNLNYLYFLLLLIPIAGVGIWVTFCCKRKRNEYSEPDPKMGKRRRSTPSWVFSDPDFDDEEVVTLEEEKK